MLLHRNVVTFAFVDEHKGRVSIVQFNCDMYTVHRKSHLVSHNLCNLLYLNTLQGIYCQKNHSI